MIIGEIPKGADKIIVSVKEFKGKQYVDIRTFFENDQGEMVPTKKGISLNAENLEEMIRLLTEARKEAAKGGKQSL